MWTRTLRRSRQSFSIWTYKFHVLPIFLHESVDFGIWKLFKFYLLFWFHNEKILLLLLLFQEKIEFKIVQRFLLQFFAQFKFLFILSFLHFSIHLKIFDIGLMQKHKLLFLFLFLKLLLNQHQLPSLSNVIEHIHFAPHLPQLPIPPLQLSPHPPLQRPRPQFLPSSLYLFPLFLVS